MPQHRFAAFSAFAIVAATLAAAAPAAAQVSVSEPWVRGVVPGQTATGAFMRLTAATDETLVAAASPVAKVVEIHQMTMDGGVMRMAAIDKLALPAGKTVELKPGGYHVMLMGLTAPLKDGDTVPLTLTVVDGAGKAQQVKVRATVRGLGTAPPPRMPAN